MGFIKSFLLLAFPLTGMATLISFRLGNELPKAWCK